MGNKIIVTVCVDNNKIIANTFYRYTSYFFERYCEEFEQYQNSKYLFSFVGEKLGEDLFFDSKRVGVCLLDDIHIYNGYGSAEASGKIIAWAGFDPLFDFHKLVSRKGGNPINGDEMESFMTGFRCGLTKGFPLYSIDQSLLDFSKKFAERQS
ncbi:hypothetical protein L6261_00385 [Candidatus Parcubacteria bacterium]|nr:hypothetical protein [Candidatus Parcubacteria bacterium]